MDDFLGLLFGIGIVALILFIVIGIINTIIEALDEILPIIAIIAGIGFFIYVLINLNTYDSSDINYSEGLRTEYINTCPDPIEISEQEVFYTELNQHLKKTEGASIEDRFDSLDSSISFLVSHLAKIGGKIDNSSTGFNEYQRSMINAFEVTNSEIFEVKSQIKKEWDQLRREKQHQGFENSKVAYISIVVAWVLSILLPPDSFSLIKEKKPKRNLRIKYYEYAGNYFNLRKLENSKFPSIDNNFCDISDKTKLVYIKKITKISLIIIIFTSIFLGIDYLYYSFLY